MAVLLAVPVLIVTLMTQMAILSRLPLLHGTADLVLLVLLAWALQEKVESAWEWTLIGGILVSFVSAMPLFTPLLIYLGITLIARLLYSRIWQVPILAMFVVTIVGTIFQHIISIFVLQIFNQTPVSWWVSLNQVTLPSALLNLLLSLPVYVVITDLAKVVHPVEDEI
jgi:hypothetical protein